MSTGSLDNIQEKKISRNFKNPKKFWKSEKNLSSRFQNFGKIDLIILPNRSNRSNRKKSLNRLDRFIGQRINTNQSSSAQFKSSVFLPWFYGMEFPSEYGKNISESGILANLICGGGHRAVSNSDQKNLAEAYPGGYRDSARLLG